MEAGGGGRGWGGLVLRAENRFTNSGSIAGLLGICWNVGWCNAVNVCGSFGGPIIGLLLLVKLSLLLAAADAPPNNFAIGSCCCC